MSFGNRMMSSSATRLPLAAFMTSRVLVPRPTTDLRSGFSIGRREEDTEHTHDPRHRRESFRNLLVLLPFLPNRRKPANQLLLLRVLQCTKKRVGKDGATMADLPVDRNPPDTPRLKGSQSLDFSRIILEIRLNDIRLYLATTAIAFENTFKDFDAKASRELDKLPADDRDQAEQDYSSMAINLTEYFPALAWTSAFVSIYALLESEMFLMCEKMQRAQRHLLGPEDLRGQGIVAAKTYLEKLGGIGRPTAGEVWHDLCIFGEMRNLVLHAGGRITEEGKGAAVFRFVQTRQDLPFSPKSGELRISKAFCEHALETIARFLQDLYDVLVRELEHQERH